MRRKKLLETKPIALGFHIYAGGFSLGVRAAGFHLAGHLEDWNFGVETSKRELSIEVWTPESQWAYPLEKYKGIDLLHGNPPCASWSNAGIKVIDKDRNACRWKTDERTNCTLKLFSIAEQLMPKVMIWECVAAAMTNGKEFVQSRAKQMRDLGYDVHLVLFNVLDLGVPQTRKRLFFVASQYAFSIDAPSIPRKVVGDIWIDDPNSNNAHISDAVAALLQCMAHDPDKPMPLHTAYNVKWKGKHPTNSRGHALGRPGFLHQRISFHAASPTVTGGQHLYHPIKDRAITPWEQQRLCGFPDAYGFSGSMCGKYAEIGKGVMPAAGQWIAEAAMRAIKKSEKAIGEIVLHDFICNKSKGPKMCHKTLMKPQAKKLKKLRRAVSIDPNAPKPHPRTDHGAREFDKTQLKLLGSSSPAVHRDYAAHWFRWGFASRYIKQGCTVLDVGCGQQQPLLHTLTRSLSTVPGQYVGVDYNKITKKSGIKWATILDEFNFIAQWPTLREYKRFDVITCFEVIEHMHEQDGEELLRGIHALLSDDGIAILSTPVYNERHMAANHIREYRHKEFEQKLITAGFNVCNVFGTFMTSNAMKKCCTPEQRAIVDALSQWYGWDVLACFLAPLYPAQSSNCCWVLKKSEPRRKLMKRTIRK